MRRGLPLLLLLLFPCPAAAEVDLFPQGFVDTAHFMQVQDDFDFLNSKTRARLELEVRGENSGLTVSANAVYNAVIESVTGVGLHEAYGEYIGEHWDLRIGRQIIVWGKADGLRIVDLLSPTDYTEFIALEFDDVRMPVDALRLRFLNDVLALELVGIPVFTPGVMPPADSPYNTTAALYEELDLQVDDAEIPEKNLSNMEGAARLSFYLPIMDFAVSALYLFDDFPVPRLETVDGEAHLLQEYHRFFALGAEASVPVGDFVFRGELAAYFDRNMQRADLIGTEEVHMLNYLVGIDWYPGSDWTIMLQGSAASVLEDASTLEQDEHTVVGTLMIQKKLLREKLTLSNMTYGGVTDRDVFNRTSVEYALTDPFHLYVGFDLFAGDEEGTFGRYSDLSSVWLKAKYSF